MDNKNINIDSKKFDATYFKNLTTSIVAQAKKMGATAAAVLTNIDTGFAVNVRKNNVETIEHSRAKNIGIKVYFGQRTGTTTTSNFKPEAIATALEKACHIARFTEEDPYVGLAAKELMAKDYPDLNLYQPWPIKISEAIELAKYCEDQGFSYDKRITNSEGVAVNTLTSFSVYANSNDFCGSTIGTKHSISCAFIATERDDMQRDYYYTTARHSLDLENFSTVAQKAAKRTVDRLGAKKITTRECPIIFTPEISQDLIGIFIQAISGRNLYRKSSFLLDNLQQPIFAKNIKIAENPLIPKALGSATFDAEGVKSVPSDIIVAGVLHRYILDSYSARKLKMNTTGNAGGVSNIIVPPGPGMLDLNGLLKKMDTGILVTEIIGDGVNIITGDYSRGIFGYWIENGQIQYPITGATIAGNLKNMFLNIKDTGIDIDRRSNIFVGSMLLADMTVAGS